jgi:hypothetical protein
VIIDLNCTSLFVVVICSFYGLTSVVVLTQNGQFSNCTTIEFNERYVIQPSGYGQYHA